MNEGEVRQCACVSCGSEADLIIACEPELARRPAGSAAPEEGSDCYCCGTEAALLDPE